MSLVSLADRALIPSDNIQCKMLEQSLLSVEVFLTILMLDDISQLSETGSVKNEYLNKI